MTDPRIANLSTRSRNSCPAPSRRTGFDDDDLRVVHLDVCVRGEEVARGKPRHTARERQSGADEKCLRRISETTVISEAIHRPMAQLKCQRVFGLFPPI